MSGAESGPHRKVSLDPSVVPPGTRNFRAAGGIPAGLWRADQTKQTLVPTHCPALRRTALRRTVRSWPQ